MKNSESFRELVDLTRQPSLGINELEQLRNAIKVHVYAGSIDKTVTSYTIDDLTQLRLRNC